MSTTTRKVQAQRKFAQGAYIPPKLNTNNVSNTTAERKTDLISAKETNNNFFHNSSSAKSLLDVVCFQNLHVHMQPVVLLERLQESQSVSAPGASNEVTPVKQTPKKHSMLLRSAGTNQKPQNKTNAKETNVAQRKIITRNIRKILSVLNRSDDANSSDCNTDDDKPLTYFTRTVKARKIKRNIKTTKRKMPRRNAIDERAAMSVDNVEQTSDAAMLAPHPRDLSLPQDEPVAMSVDEVVQTSTAAMLAPHLRDSSLPLDEPVAMSVDKVGQMSDTAMLAPHLRDSSLPPDSRHALQSHEMLYIRVDSSSITQDEPVATSVDKVEVSSEASFESKGLDAPLIWDEPVAMSDDKVVQTSDAAMLAPHLRDSSLPMDEPVAMSVDKVVQTSDTVMLAPHLRDSSLSLDEPVAMSVDKVVQSSDATFIRPQPVDAPLLRGFADEKIITIISDEEEEDSSCYSKSSKKKHTYTKNNETGTQTESEENLHATCGEFLRKLVASEINHINGREHCELMIEIIKLIKRSKLVNRCNK